MLVSYLCQSGCKPRATSGGTTIANRKKREYFEKYDLEKLREIDSKPIPHWYPPTR